MSSAVNEILVPDRTDIKEKINYHSFPRLQSLQGLRAFAFICIFLHHSSLHGMEPLGPYGVSVFIILSGFLMGGKYIANNTEVQLGLGFVVKKMTGLYPLHIFTMLAMFIYYYLTSAFLLLSFIYGVIANILMITPYCNFFNIKMQSFNGPSWYLAVCVITYLFFPIILKIMKKYRSGKQAYIAIVLSIFAIFLISFISKQSGSLEMQKHLTYNFPVFRLPEFIIGCNMGYLFVTGKKGSRNSNGILLSLITICITLASWIIYDHGFLFMSQ